MRIAIVTANQQLVGGVETYVSWLLAALVERRHEVGFAFESAAAEPRRAVDHGIEPLVRWDLQHSTRARFLEQLSAFRPEIVFLQGCRDDSLDRELALRFRAVLFAHMFYGACATGWRVHRLPTRQICTRRFGPACLPVNYLRACGARNPLQLLRLYSSQAGRSRVLGELTAVVVASEYMREVYLQHGVPARDVHVIPCPTERAPDPTPPAARTSLDHVLFLGRLTSGKGGARAIQAIARAQRSLGRTLHLTMAGDGPELPRCKRLALKLGIQADFPGWIDPRRRLELLRQSDVLIVPSLWPEPFGMVGLEAGSVGVPAVAYRVGGIVDWLRPGETGELAQGRGFGSRALAAALERVLRDAVRHRELQLGAWHMASEFSGERHLAGLEQLFERVLAAEK